MSTDIEVNSYLQWLFDCSTVNNSNSMFFIIFPAIRYGMSGVAILYVEIYLLYIEPFMD